MSLLNPYSACSSSLKDSSWMDVQIPDCLFKLQAMEEKYSGVDSQAPQQWLAI